MNRTHGHSGRHKTPTYRSWFSMHNRCGLYADPAQHQSYAERGIAVCERWNSFEAFLADMGERPPGTQIDRIDNDGNYEPGNCQWLTPQENTQKRCSTKINSEVVKVIRHLRGRYPMWLLAALHNISRSHAGEVSTGNRGAWGNVPATTKSKKSRARWGRKVA